ncbi:hypothetical protein D3C86_1707800 [compost metagenome]
MTDHPDDLVLVDQAVGHRHRLLRLAGVVALDQLDRLAVDAAGGVDVGRRLARAAPVLLADRRTGAGVRAGHADQYLGLNHGRQAQRGGHREGEKAFSCNLLRHGGAPGDGDGRSRRATGVRRQGVRHAVLLRNRHNAHHLISF